MTVGNARRALRSLRSRQNSISSEELKYGSSIRAGLCVPRYRLLSQYLLPGSKHASSAARNRGKGFYNSCSRNYTSVSSSGSIAYNAQVAWKRLAQATIRDRQKADLTINKIAQAVSLGLSRSYFIVPGLFTFICGSQMALANAVQETDVLPLRNSFYTHAEDSHLFLTRMIISGFESLILLLRALYLSFLFAPSIAMAPFADSFGPEFRKLWLQVVHRTLERAGPAFIKWGQWAATRPDLFPRDLCIELSKLHTKAPEHSFAFTKKAIEKAFGRRISEIFDDFEEEPVASGSIAQVHRASLRSRYPGRQVKPMLVAVKVRHPGVGESIKRDFEIINIVARMSRFIPALNWLRLDESVQQFAVFMMSQVDLAREAAHLSRFIYNFRQWKDVSFPKPVYPLVHPAVLVETFEHGESVSHYVDELEGKNDRVRSALAHIGTHALLKMLLVSNLLIYFLELKPFILH